MLFAERDHGRRRLCARTGKEMRIIVDDGSEPAILDAGLACDAGTEEAQPRRQDDEFAKHKSQKHKTGQILSRA